MIGSFLTRGLVMILGYVYPAYECFKTVERNKPEIEQLRFWCQYWILVAVLTVFERVADTFVSWVPMYGEAKLAFIVFLWYPKTQGTRFVYDSFFKPYVSKHETEIDRNLLELRTRAGDMAFMYCQRAVSYSRSTIFETLQYVAAQSTSRPRPTQAEEQTPRAQQAPVMASTAPAKVPPRQPSTRVQPPQPKSQTQVEEPLSPTSSVSSSQQEDEMEDEQSSIQSSSTSAPSAAPSPLKKSVSMPIPPDSPRRPVTNKIEKPTAKSTAPPQETVMEESIRVTRGRLRKTQSTLTK